MGLLSRLRRRSKSQSRAGNAVSYEQHLRMHSDPPPLPANAVYLFKQLPNPVLARILSFVCPHAADSSYDTSEESMTEDGCMLCDMRDLAHCALVCRRWYSVARSLLYVLETRSSHNTPLTNADTPMCASTQSTTAN